MAFSCASNEITVKQYKQRQIYVPVMTMNYNYKLTTTNDKRIILVNGTIGFQKVWFQVYLEKISVRVINRLRIWLWKACVIVTYPVRPSTVSSMGRMCTRVPYLTSGHDWIETMSDRCTRKLLRTTRFIRIFSFGQLSSDSTIQTVSLRRRPFSRTVSPRNNCNSSILACDSATTELSSFKASSTSNRFGRSLRFRIAVAKSSGLKHKKK